MKIGLYRYIVYRLSRLRISFGSSRKNAYTLSFLNKSGCLSITSILPKHITCSPCQLAKAHDVRGVHLVNL